MQGSMIEFASPSGSGTTPGYLSLTETGSGPGLVLIQEWWGLVDHIKILADRFAAAGFVTLAPDLYHGDTARSPDQAQKMLMALDIDRAGNEIHAAANHLLAMPQVRPNKIGVIGFCMGGQLALYAATEYPDAIAACVDFYGIHPNVNIDATKLQVPVLAHFGNTDALVTNGTAPALMQKFSDAGKFVDTYYYDAGHAFFNDTRPEAYNADAASLAWDRTLAFLRDNLR
ncbi:MAG: dienelactone hydrolase family protein [Gemmatimonadaceae bacterium]